VTQMLSEVPTPRGGADRSDAVPTPPAAAPQPVPGPPAGAGQPGDEIALETRRGRLLVRFSGEIDTALRARFDQVLAVVRAAHEPVDVDCREVTFFGAEGIRMLVLLQRVTGGPGVAEFQPSAYVERALRLSGIERYPFG
jgi:anti-anti-sigma regulatory factor